MKKFKRILTLIIAVVILTSVLVVGNITTASASGSGAGLTAWAYRAYNEGWSYVWGGTSVGAVDCSGLIYSYAGGARTTEEMIAAAPESGSMDSIPRIHGLGLYQYGHVGVYVGGGMGIDARDEISNVCIESISTKSWTQWFKVAGVSYPTSGWQEVAGNYYYYEDGQYVVSTSRTIDGVTYSFGSDGKSDSTPGDTSATAESSGSSVKKVKKTAYSIGDSGKAVTKLQKRLKELGFYNDEITGYFGEVTEKAYKEFQTAAGVVVDGVCGKTDRDILYSTSAPYAEVEEEKTEDKTEDEDKDKDKEEENANVMSVGDYSDDVYSVQERLIELKYFNDDATGYFGQLTEQAVKDFQDYNEIESTGEVDENTQKTLFSDDAIANPEAKEEMTEEKEEVTSEDKTEEKEEVEETAPAPSSSVVLESNEMASNALEGLASDSNFESVANNSNGNLDIIKWLVVVIAVMGAVFVVVLVNERKKASRRRKHAMARSRRYW